MCHRLEHDNGLLIVCEYIYFLDVLLLLLLAEENYFSISKNENKQFVPQSHGSNI